MTDETTRRDHDDRIRTLLRELPRSEASPGFARRVYDRIDNEGRPGLRVRGALWTAAALATVIGLLSLGAWHLERERTDQQARLELAELKAEQRSIADEIRRLREQTAGAGQVFLGGDDHVEFVYDLTRPKATNAQPASFHGPIQPAP